MDDIAKATTAAETPEMILTLHVEQVTVVMSIIEPVTIMMNIIAMMLIGTVTIAQMTPTMTGDQELLLLVLLDKTPTTSMKLRCERLPCEGQTALVLVLPPPGMKPGTR